MPFMKIVYKIEHVITNSIKHKLVYYESVIQADIIKDIPLDSVQ